MQKLTIFIVTHIEMLLTALFEEPRKYLEKFSKHKQNFKAIQGLINQRKGNTKPPCNNSTLSPDDVNNVFATIGCK